eukprot:13183547-Alexandrium_andersonii.AAC.1
MQHPRACHGQGVPCQQAARRGTPRTAKGAMAQRCTRSDRRVRTRSHWLAKGKRSEPGRDER